MSGPSASPAAGIPASRETLFRFLDDLGIGTQTHEHPAAFTVEEAREHWQTIPGVHCKNLFLRDAKKVAWLVVCPADRVIDLRTLPGRIGSGRLSFGSAERLAETLGVIPGAVTPFALLNDRHERRVRVVLDAWMMDQPSLAFHPLENTATTVIAAADLSRFIAACGHAVQITDLC